MRPFGGMDTVICLQISLMATARILFPATFTSISIYKSLHANTFELFEDFYCMYICDFACYVPKENV